MERAAPIAFSERLRNRRRVWWGQDGGRRSLHQLRELLVYRSRHDADQRWRCCPQWPRTLTNKWNARQLAQRHGIGVPTLYWCGRRTAALPVDALPADLVVRPVHGASGRGVLVLAGGEDLLGGGRVPRAELRAALRRRHGRLSRWPLLVEEFIVGEPGAARLPTEYKCYTFGATVALVQVVQRTAREHARHRFYAPDWTPIDDPINRHNPPAPPTAPPAALADILRGAAALGAVCGTFMRIDFFATDRGGIFNEFATTPNNGLDFTPYADAWLGELWSRLIPDRS